MKSTIHPKTIIGESADNVLRGTLQNQYITYLSVTLLVPLLLSSSFPFKMGTLSFPVHRNLSDYT